MTPLLRRPICVLDTETTGFPEQPWSRVVEVAAVLLDTDGTEIDAVSTLVRPEIHDARAIHAERIHGLTREALVDAPMATGALAMLADSGVYRYPCTSFNLSFDRPMLERMGFDPRGWAPCIMLAAYDIMGPAGALVDCDRSHPRYDDSRPWLWPSLAGAADFFGCERVGDPHLALSDARLAAAVLVEIARRWRDINPTERT